MKPLGRSIGAASLAMAVSAFPAKALTEAEVESAAKKIDSLVETDLDAAGLSPNATVDDGIFLRRSYLGIIGRIPTEDECRDFFTDESPDKRTELIDALVASPGFDSHLFNWAGDLLRLQTKQEQFGLGWHVWLRKSLAEDKPWDVLVGEMLGSEGHAAKNPAVGYYLRDRNMQLDNFSNTMQVFLGRQIGCAQCHDHPFDDWSQHEYYEMAAFGGGFTYDSKDLKTVIKRVSTDLFPVDEKTPSGKKGNKAGKNRPNDKVRKALGLVFRDFNKNAIFDDPEKSLRLPADYQYRDAEPKSEVAAKTLFGERIEGVAPEDRRGVFAEWVTSPENPYFTKVIANRIWARVFGHGLQEPIDDWNEDSIPAHPELLEFLEELMKRADYDLRTFSQVLFRTALFQRECSPEEVETGVAPLVQGPALQRMSAEQLFDSMLVLTREEINDGALANKVRQWQTYVRNVDAYLKKDSKELMEIGESALLADQKFEKLRNEVRRLQAEVSKATDGEAKRQAIAIMKEKQEMLRAYNSQRYPLANGSMEMGGGGGNSRKDAGRASEHPAPFNPGSLVREFGGSDRSIPSSGDTIPTVPQALALLNDQQTDIIKGKGTPLGRRLSSVETAEEKLEIVFLRLYSRLPTEAESERYLPVAAEKEAFASLIRAMLTSNPFIFIQ